MPTFKTRFRHRIGRSVELGAHLQRANSDVPAARSFWLTTAMAVWCLPGETAQQAQVGGRSVLDHMEVVVRPDWWSWSVPYAMRGV